MPPKKSLGKKVIRFQIRLPPELYVWLYDSACRAGVPVAVFLRRLIRESMRRNG